MTTQIQTTAAMRRFNQVLERADLLMLKYCPIEPSLARLHDRLRSKGYTTTAAELKLAGEAVGYFKEKNL